MFRLRFTAFAAAAGIGLACGCLSLTDHPLLSRFRHHECAPECMDVGAVPDCGMPLDGAMGPVLPPPTQVPPPGTLPDRLEPVPQGSPRVPYNPTTKSRADTKVQTTGDDKNSR